MGGLASHTHVGLSRILASIGLLRSHAGSGEGSIAAANPASYRATATVLFLNGDVAAVFTVGTIAPIARSVATTLFVGLRAFRVAALTPTLTALVPLLLGIANTHLRTTIWADAELDRRLSHRGCADKKAGTHRGYG
jgi:hypothetical protein